MITQDKRIINKLRRRLGISLILVFILFYWIIQKNYDLDYYESYNEMILYDNIEKDEVIEKLKSQIDSLKSNNDVLKIRKESNILINKKNINKKDTIIVVEKTEQKVNNQSDTLNR